jgi:thioredoxin-related protein
MRKHYPYIYILLGTLLIAHIAFAQPKAVHFNQLDSLQKAENRITIVFIHTNWCKHCTAMKQTTLNHKEIKGLLNEQFYLVMLDAEERQPISWRDTTFQFKPTGVNTGVHELALQLGAVAGEISYPMLVFLNPQFEIIYQQNGYIAFQDLKKILKTLLNGH